MARPIDPQSQDPSRRSLEEEKARLEIKNLKLEWWKKPSYIGILAPTVLGLAGLMVGILSGYFNLESKRLELDRAELRRDIREFESERDSLEESVAALEKKLQGTKKDHEQQLKEKSEQLEEEKQKVQDLRNLYSQVSRKVPESERGEYQKTIRSLEKKITELKHSEQLITQELAELASGNPVIIRASYDDLLNGSGSIRGLDFGYEEGVVYLKVVRYSGKSEDPKYMFSRPIRLASKSITEWGDSLIHVDLSASEANRIEEIKRTLQPGRGVIYSSQLQIETAGGVKSTWYPVYSVE